MLTQGVVFLSLLLGFGEIKGPTTVIPGAGGYLYTVTDVTTGDWWPSSNPSDPSKIVVVPMQGLGGETYLFVQVSSPGTYYLNLNEIKAKKSKEIVITATGTPRPPPVDPVDPDDPKPPPIVETATAATYVYEKDSHTLPSAVLAALNRLNRERKIVATAIEADVRDGTGDVPEQYKVPLAAAKEAGLPALVVTGSKGVIRVVKSPTTEQQVLDAVPAEVKK